MEGEEVTRVETWTVTMFGNSIGAQVDSSERLLIEKLQ